LTDVPKMLPLHHFSYFETDDIFNRMKCDLYGDSTPEGATQCLLYEKRKCLSKGETTQAYESCMIDLYNKKSINSTLFCENHYKDFSLWEDKLNPSYSLYWQKKHFCYFTSGKKYSREYCQDLKTVKDGWGLQEVYSCYAQKNINFTKEYCDNEFQDDKIKLMQCYGQKGLYKGEEYCESYFVHPMVDFPSDTKSMVLTKLISCYDDINLKNKNYCDHKQKLDNLNIINSVASCGDPLAVCTADEVLAKLKTCYENEAKIVLDKTYCDS
jgi:hypothetical protein